MRTEYYDELPSSFVEPCDRADAKQARLKAAMACGFRSSKKNAGPYLGATRQEAATRKESGGHSPFSTPPKVARRARGRWRPTVSATRHAPIGSGRARGGTRPSDDR